MSVFWGVLNAVISELFDCSFRCSAPFWLRNIRRVFGSNGDFREELAPLDFGCALGRSRVSDA